MQRKLISFDWAMKKLLRSQANFDILEGFLSELLQDTIQILEVLESESNKNTARNKFNRVDLKVKNQKHEIIIVEVQYDRELDYLQRMLFGTSKVITETLNEGEPYSKIVKVISVNILYFDLGQGKDYIYSGTTTFRGRHYQDTLALSIQQKTLYSKRAIYEVFPEYYIIKVNEFDDIAKDTLDEWIYFLKNEEIKEGFRAQGLKKAKQALDILKLPEQERLAYARYQNDLHYQASMVESSYTIGKMDGIEEGIKEGMKEGKAEGIKERNTEIARNLLAADRLDIPTISEMTGLTVKEVEQLGPK